MKQVDKPEGQIPTVKDNEADVWSVRPYSASLSFYGGNLTLLNQWNTNFPCFTFSLTRHHRALVWYNYMINTINIVSTDINKSTSCISWTLKVYFCLKKGGINQNYLIPHSVMKKIIYPTHSNVSNFKTPCFLQQSPPHKEYHPKETDDLFPSPEL